MRTTLTLNEDVAARAKALARQLDRPFKQVINEALRKGLELLDNPPESLRYETQPRSMGLRPGLSLDNIGELLAQVEGEAFK